MLRLMILRLLHNGCNVVILPHTLKLLGSSGLDDESAVADLFGLLDEDARKRVVVYRPKTIAEDIEIMQSLDMLITSRMHAGIVALAYGKPALFFMPKDDVKFLDILGMLDLDVDAFAVDAFDLKEHEKLFAKVEYILDNLSKMSSHIENQVNSLLPTVKKPIEFAKKLIEL